MADNKKTKTSFADGLKAQAEKIVPKKTATSDDVVMVDLGDGPIPIPRADMSDAEWANVKKRATVVEDSDPKAKTHNWSDIMSLAQDVRGRAKGLVSKEEADLLEKTNEWDRAEFIRQRMKNKGYLVPINSAQDERETLRNPKQEPGTTEKEHKAPPPAREASKLTEQTPTEAQGTPDEWKGIPGTTPSPSTQTEMDSPQASAPGMSPRANMQAMMMGATPAPETGSTPGLGDAGLAQANAKGEQHATEDAAWLKSQIAGPPIEQQPGIVPSLYRAGQALSNSPAGDFVRNVVAPDAGSFPGAITSDQAATLPPSPNAGVIPGAPSPEMPAAPHSPDGSGGSMSASLSMPGGFTPAKTDPALMQQWADDAAKARAQADSASETIAAGEVVKDGLVRKAAEREMLVQGEAAKLATLASEAKLRSVNEARRYDTAKLAVMEQARKASADPINPNRYWQDKSAGQQAAAVIAGALFGFTGQGMQWLQRIDGLVNADNQLQAADRASKVAGLDRQANALGEAGQQALKLGATDAEAHLIERSAKLEGLKSYLDTIVMKTNNMDQKARGAQMSVQLAQSIAALDQQGVELAQQKANADNTAMYHNATLQQQKAAISAKLAAAGAKGGQGSKIPQAQQGIISAAEAGLGMIPELEKAIGNPKGELSTAAMDQIAKQFPGTDANNRSISTAFLNRAIFAGIDKSVINAADQKFLDEIQSGVGISSLRKPGAIAALKRMLNESKKAAIRTAKSLDQNIGDLPTGDAPSDDFGFEAAQ